MTQAIAANVLAETLGSLDLNWPEVSSAEHAANLEARKRLENEPLNADAGADARPTSRTSSSAHAPAPEPLAGPR